MKGRPFTDRPAAQARAADLYRAGHTIACVAALIDRPWSTARNLLRDANVPLRARGHASRCTANHTQENTMPNQPNTLTPDEVNAIVRNPDDPRYPSKITVFCDHCGVENTGEYMVSTEMSPTERLAVARTHLVNNEGWEHNEYGDDFCPTHAGSTD